MLSKNELNDIADQLLDHILIEEHFDYAQFLENIQAVIPAVEGI